MPARAITFKPLTKAQEIIDSSSFSSHIDAYLKIQMIEKIREGKGWTDGDHLKGRESKIH